MAADVPSWRLPGHGRGSPAKRPRFPAAHPLQSPILTQADRKGLLCKSPEDPECTPMPVLSLPYAPLADAIPPLVGVVAPVLSPATLPLVGVPITSRVSAAADPVGDDDEELGDEEDLSVGQPPADEDSTFDDFDDEFDDDFEEEENDPDWDHPDEGDPPPPPSKGTGRKK